MNLTLLEEIEQINPWLADKNFPIIDIPNFIPRIQLSQLQDVEWDRLLIILEGPRRAGKTTLGKFLAQDLMQQQRYQEFLYLNCDFQSIRQWLTSPLFVKQACEEFSLKLPILMIDEVQRLENPGLLLKAVIDLGLPIKFIATGSSQLEIKSKVQEFLTGRQLTSLILPLSHEEWALEKSFDEVLLFGSYPQIIRAKNKEIQLAEIFNRYIQKDIIEILKIRQPDVFKQLVILIAHSSGQLVNINQFALDCKVSVTTIRNYLDILEQTFVIAKITPFVGNKRVEITSNPKYYFIDNGFRNTALRNFSDPNTRTDLGLLVEGFIFQELFKFRPQHYLLFDIYFWRTKSGAEVDFVIYKNENQFLPIEVKYQNFTRPTISRSFRSFVEAYQPKKAIIITKDFLDKISIDACEIYFMPIKRLHKIFEVVRLVLI